MLGFLWQAGYENGAYSTPLFTDVVPQLQKWQASSLDLAIYSSGSVFAQKLLFGHVKDRQNNEAKATLDLQDLIKHWFDTTNAGPKLESSSYARIAAVIERQIEQVLFLSDNVHEVQAALDAGMKAIVVDRPGNADLSNDDRRSHLVVGSLEEIRLRDD